MKRAMLTSIFLFCLSVGAFATNDFNAVIQKYDSLYQMGKYEQLIKELIPMLNSDALNSYENVSQKGIIYINKLIADSYRMLEMYTNAYAWYWENEEGHFDNYAKYCNLLLNRISVIKGIEEKKPTNSVFQHYTGGAGPNPPHEGSLMIILGQLLNTNELVQKKTYLREWASYDKNNDWVTSLTKFCADDLTLDNLKSIVQKDDFATAMTYAGLSLEISGNISQARELYTQVLKEKSDKIETLLAANRMGLFALKMIFYNKEGDYANLPIIYASKVSSAKLEAPRLYSAKNLIDDDPSTTWVPVGKNSQIGEWVEISFDEPVQINSLTLTNGFARNDVTFKNNNRIKTATLEFSDGSKLKITLEDTMKPQIIKVNKRSRKVKLIIDEVYKGVKYDDTCLSGIEIDFKH